MPQEETLVIGDAHVAPGQTLRRWEALRRFIVRRKLHRIVFIGDLVDMASLSRFDAAGSKAMEGLRIRQDIDSGLAAVKVLLDGLPHMQVVYIEGNHEERLQRMYAEHPKLEGTIDLAGEFASAAGGHDFTFTPYREYFALPCGLLFTHIPHNAMKPIESVAGARKVLQHMAKSVVYGHTHQLDFASLARNGAEQIHGLNVGCFIEPQHDPAYMQGKIKNWWRGVVVVRHQPSAPWRGEFETVGLKALLQT